jgi:hypothetical protein
MGRTGVRGRLFQEQCQDAPGFMQFLLSVLCAFRQSAPDLLRLVWIFFESLPIQRNLDRSILVAFREAR